MTLDELLQQVSRLTECGERSAPFLWAVPEALRSEYGDKRWLAGILDLRRDGTLEESFPRYTGTGDTPEEAMHAIVKDMIGGKRAAVDRISEKLQKARQELDAAIRASESR